MAPELLPFFTRVRYASSFISTALLNLNVFGVSLRSVCSPGMNCHGCPWAATACPVGILAFGSAVRTLPVLALGFVLAVGVLFGRLACSFLCPFGLLQDLLYRIPTRKISLPRAARYVKYAALILLVLALPFLLGFEQKGYVSVGEPQAAETAEGALSVMVTVTNLGNTALKGLDLDVVYYGRSDGREISRIRRSFPDKVVEPEETAELLIADLPPPPPEAAVLAGSPQSVIAQTPRYSLYYCKLCPVGTLTATIPAYFAGMGSQIYAWSGGTWLRLGILAFFIVLMVLSSRPFCRTFCPLGAIYALAGRVSVSRIEVDKDLCVACGLCDKVCPVELDVMKEAGGAECIACGDCIAACPKGAVRRRFGP